METKLLVLLALVVTASAGPIAVQESDKCSDEICEKGTNFEYATGSTFTYGYRADTTTSMEGAAEDTAKLTIDTTADIEVLSPCEFALRLSQTRLLHSDSTGQLKAADKEQTFRRAVEASELRFAFHNGVVKHVCCGNEPEDTWVINFKKGVLSTFQNSMDDVTTSQNVTETDVAGTCLTEYEVTSNGYYSTEVKKTKDILSCTGRNHHKTMLHMSPYNVPSEIQNVPIMKTTHECEQSFQKGGVLKTSTCLEKHVFRPFANGNSGATTTVKATMTYKTTSYTVKTRPAAIVSKDSLAFDHSGDKLDSKMARVEVEHRLREICDASRFDIRPESARQFSELVSAMRSVSQSDLEDLHQLLKSKTLCSDNEKTLKFFLDALPVTNTDASIKLMVSLITSNDIKGVLAQAWITSLGFVKSPTSEMLLSVKTLIDEAKTTEASLLPVSAMVNNYCRKMTSCEEDYAVLSIMASLERNIGYQCDASGENFGKVLLSLRAIGNAGHASRAVGLINKCMTQESNPLEIRVAAAQAFRRMPCLNDAQNDDLWTTYENGDLDSELRVAAYLALMRCPTDATLSKMAASLLNEECDQVGAFVYSHLTNLRSTSDPHRQDVAKAAKNILIGKEFELSTLKFSRNFEFSALINKLNVGFAAESNVIWSSKSQMPRSISGNLTIDLFGQAVNLMDFGARMEGLEYLVKNVFGPYMQNNNVEQTETKAEDVKGSVYGRVFGNEMFFMNSETVKSPFGKMPSSWLDLLIQLSKKQDYTMTQSAQFMDVSMVIPTVAGLPIHMDVNGTSTLDLVLKGKLDVRKLGASPRSMDIDGEIRPSAAVEITGTMSVDAMVTKTGLRMRNTMHTSTSLKGRVQLERGMLLNVELDTPQKKMEVFSANSKFFILHNNMEQEQKMITENRREFKVCSGDKLATIAGLEICGELSFPNASMVAASPIFPMTGPTSASVTLHKRDSHNSYKLFAKRVENKKSSTAQISFNTPGSKVDRAMLMDIDIQYPKKTLDVTMRTPWKKAAIRGVAINKDKLKSLAGSLVIDDVDTYSFTTEVKVDNSKAKLELSPMLEVRRVGAEDVQLTGFVSVMKPFKAVDVDLSLSGIDKMPYTLKTSLTNSKKGMGVKGSFSMDGKRMYTLEASQQLSVMGKKSTIATLKSLLKINTPTKQLVSFMGNADYREDKSLKGDVTVDIYRLTKKPANLKFALLKNEKKKGVRYDVDVALKSSGISGKLDHFTFIKKAGLVATKSVLGYTIPKFAKNKITLGGKFNDRSTKAFKKYSLKSNLDVQKNPEYNLGLNIDLDHKKKHSEADIELKYGSNPKDKTKRMVFSTSLNRKLATWKNAILTYKINALAPAHEIDMGVLGKHQHTPKMLDSSINFNYGGKGKDVSAMVTLKDKSKQLGKYNGKAVVAWPGKEYTIATAMDQQSANQYINTLNLKSKSGVKHSITTMYNMPGAKAHEFSTEINLANVKPITLSGSTTLNPRNFALSGEVLIGKDAYGFKTVTKVTTGPDGKATAEIYYPTRRMTMLVEGGVQKSKYNGKMEAAWDVDNDKTKTIVIVGSSYVKASKNSMSLGADMSFNSPFENFEDLTGSFKYGSDSGQNDISGKFSWGGKGNTIASRLNVKSPITLKNLKVIAEAKTPFKGFRVISVEVDHTVATMLKTILKGTWDKENGILTIEGENLSDDNSRNIKGSMALKSSIKNAENVKLNFAHQDSAGRLASNGALTYEGKPFSYDINMEHSQNGWQIKNTGDLNLVILTTNVITSWKHKNSENHIKSSLSSSWGNNKVLINLDGAQDLINSGSMNGELKIKSPWKPVADLELSLSHKHSHNQLLHKSLMKQGGKVRASSVLKYNGGPTVIDGEFGLTSPYHEDITGKINFVKNPMTGLVEITWAPKTKASSSFKYIGGPSDFDFEFVLSSPYNHDITGKINSNYGEYPMIGMAEMNWARNNKASSFVKYNGGPSVIDGEFGLTSPYHEDITGKINFVKNPMTGLVEITWAPKTKASSFFKYIGGPSNFDFEFGLTSPYNDDITGTINSDYSKHPMTGMAELRWSPKSKAVVEGSVNVIAWNDAYVDVKMTTPLKAYRNIVFKASNKEEKGETVSHMNLDYGVRKNFDVESRVAFSDMKKMFRLKMRTPFEKVKSIETGFLATGDLMNFDSSADFELLPVLGKLQTSLKFQYDDKLKGTFRVETPFKEYPYFELSTSSINKGRMRVSYISAEHYPRKVYRLDTTYAIDMPYSLEATIRSPFPEYDNLGVAFQHSQSESNIMSHVEVQYQPNKKIEGDLNLDWSSNYEGSLIVKTPFAGYETSKVMLRHKSEKRSFSSHGEVSVAEKTISADANFIGGYKTKGTFSVTTPIPGYETVEIIVNKRGNKNGMRGNAAFILNGKRSQANFNHKMNAKSLKSAFSVISPYSKIFKMSMDHNGDMSTFTNKMSVNYGRAYDIDTVMAFDYRGNDISGNGMIKAQLAGPRRVARVSFSKAGAIEAGKFSGSGSYNRKDISVNGDWKINDGVKGSIHVTTPFNGFKTVGATLTQTGSDLTNFDIDTNVNYMDKKNINGKMAMSSDGLRRIRFNTEVATPFKGMKSTKMTIEHDYDMDSLVMSGGAKMYTTIGKLGHGSITYAKSGDFENFNAQLNGKFAGDEAIMTVTKRGNMEDLTVSTSAGLNGQMISLDGSFKSRDGIDGSMMVKTPFADYKTVSLNFVGSKIGSFESLTMSTSASLNSESISLDGSFNRRGGIDGALTVKTPFDKFNNVGFKVTHHGEMNDFNSQASIDYMDNKNINSQVEFVANGGRMRLTGELNTPRDLIGDSKILLQSLAQDTNIELKGAMNSDIARFGEAAFQFTKTGNLDDISVIVKATCNGDEIINGRITNALSTKAFNTFASLETKMTPKLEFTIDHSGDFENFNSKATGILGTDNVISLESSMTTSGDVIEGKGQLMYRTSGLGGCRSSILISKEGKMNDFRVSVSGDIDNKKMSIVGAMKYKNEVTASLTATTPFDGYKTVGMTFKQTGDLERFNIIGDITVADEQTYSAKLDFYKYLLARIETTLEVRTPCPSYEFTKFEWRHESDNGLFKCYSTVEYGNSKKITYDMKATMTPNPTFTVTLKTPFSKYEEIMATGSFVNTWPVASLTGKVNAGDGNVISVDGSIDVTKDKTGSLSIKTPMEGFTNTGLNFQYSGSSNNLKSGATITYMDRKDITGKFIVRKNGQRIIAELKTPFSGFESTTFEVKGNSNDKQYYYESTLVYGNNQIIKETLKIVYKPNPEMLMTIRTPFEGLESMSASYSLDMTAPKYSLDGNLNAGNGRAISLTTRFDMTEDITGFATLKTPIAGYRNLGVSFSHTGNANKFQSQGKLTFADRKDISGSINFYRYMWRHLAASAALNTPFAGFESTKAELKFEDRQKTMTASSELVYGDTKKVEGIVKVMYSPNYDVHVTVNTPFSELRNVMVMATADMNAPSYIVTSGFTYNYNKAYSFNGKLNMFSTEKLDGSIEVKTPIYGLEYTKVEYEHKVDSSNVDGSASLTYENGNKVYSAELQSTYYPSVDASLNVKTPLAGYTSIHGAVAYDSSYKKYDTSSSLKVEGRNLYTMSSGLDYSVEPMRAHTKISTPYRSIRDVELVLTHEGQLYNFKSTGFLASPMTDNINAEAFLNYEGPFDMSTGASMKSSLVGMDDLKFELKNTDLSGEKKISAVAGWTDGQQIVADVVYSAHKSWSEDSMTADVVITTPFVLLRSFSSQATLTTKEGGYEKKLAVEMNGATMLDYSTEYSSKDRHEASITFKAPMPMVYSAGFSNKDGNMEGDLLINWNRDDVNSNIHLTGAMADNSDSSAIDRSIDVTVECHTRTMGVSHTQKASGSSMTSTGKVFWDTGDDNKVSYDLQMGESSRRNKMINDATLKLELPSRTLELTGSLSDSKVTKIADATFMWDAQRDTNKQVGLKATITTGNSMRGDVTLSLPSIRKEIRVDGELMLDNGRIILDSKTDISYSSDSSKTLTLTSKVADIKDYSAYFNYSVELGVRHPYTNIDMKMNSHIGSSDESMTVGMETSYLTAKRQTKNLALLAEINKLKKQISLKMFNPDRNIEIIGDVISTSPSKYRLLNRVDDVEIFSSELTIDTDKSSAEINTVCGTDKYGLVAMYPSNTEFQAFMSHTTPEADHKEALLALRLNTSRLLHSRLAWRPQMWNDMTSGMEEKAASLSIEGAEMWTIMNAAVADEIEAKYQAVTYHVKDEMTPLIDILERELRRTAYKMNKISKDLKAIYDNNDFYVQTFAENYIEFQGEWEKVVMEYRRTYTDIITAMRQGIDNMSAFPIREQYLRFARSTMANMGLRVYSTISALEDYTDRVEMALRDYKEKTQQYANSVAGSVSNASYVNYVTDKLSKVKNFDISPYVNRFEIPEEYSNAIDSVRSTAVEGLQYVWERPELDMLRGNINNIYQQGAWAYKYWNVQENLKTNLENIKNLVIEIVKDELKEVSTSCQALYKIKNPITVWAPEQGEIQAELHLPIEVKSLKELPDVSPLVKRAEKVANQVAAYLPDQKTWESIKESVTQMLPTPQEKEVSPVEELKMYKPSRKNKKYRLKKKGGKRMKHYKQ